MAKIRKFAGFIVALLGFTAAAHNLYAQNYYIENENTFFGGPVLGANFTQVDGDSYAGYHKVGLNVGGIVYSKFSDFMAGSVEILYTQRGSKSNGPQKIGVAIGANEIRNYSIKLNYAEIPVMLNFFDKRRSHISAGFSYAQLVSSKESITTDNPKFDDTVKLDRYAFKKSDISVVLGLNLRVYKGFYFNVRFQYSLVPVRKGVYTGLARAEQYNNSYVVRLVYLFGQNYKKSPN
ncbi:MAG: PorT family protein [Bacteroidetes bacterium]|nr:PorT family protein [Bacteroidota bacterium]